MAKYSRIDKDISTQPRIGLAPRDTIPVNEPEEFDRPFGSDDYQYQPHNPDPFAKEEDQPARIFQAQKVDVGEYKPKLYKIPQAYSGFKIEIKKTEKPLTAGNDIFFQHGNLFAEKLKDGSFSYMLGEFSSAEEAGDFLSDFLAQRYPEARVVEYREGERYY